MKFATVYDHPRLPGLTCTEPSHTQQQYAEDADINNVIRSYQETGTVPTSSGREPIFGDFSAEEIGDYAAALRTIHGVGDLMMQLPAKVRSRFENNPLNILAFLKDPANKHEAIELGLIDPPEEPARVVDTEPPKTSK